jgi:protein O-mannosyl-transferase
MPNSPFVSARGGIWLAVACLVAAILAAYHNSFSGPFIFDDGPAILGNPTIRHLSAPVAVLSPPRERGQTVGGRPLVNLSLAINYALGGEEVRGYHAFNLGVHLLAALAFFGLARRTLLQPALIGRFGPAATPLALAMALLWAVHPLQTEAVAYVIQRAESLMGLFYLLTLYCFVRAAEADAGATEPATARRYHGWLLAAAAACLLGMATKEVMVSAPLLVLLYDRTFVAGSWREAWARRRGFYLGLAATWLLLGWLVLGTANRGGTAGLGTGDSPWTYVLTQNRALLLYLRLAFWPRPLVLDYGTDLMGRWTEALPFAPVVVLLLAGTLVALWRWPAVGLLGAWFFAILAPSSSFVPIAVQPIAEHRMYLPLAAVIALVVAGVYAAARRAGWFVLGAAAAALLAATSARNEFYRTSERIWAETVAQRPRNARAQCYYGDALAAGGRFPEALAHYDEAIRLDRPAAARGDRSILGDVLVNSGNVLRSLGREAEAADRYAEAERADPDLAAAPFNLGCLDLLADRRPAAIAHFERALKLEPNFTAAHTSLGSALLLDGRTAPALAHYEEALRLDPSAQAHRNLGLALMYARRTREGAAQLAEAARLDPDPVPAGPVSARDR